MTLEEFVNSFARQFEETDPSLIKETTDFKNLEEWDSLMALSVIAMADEEFGVTLSGDDIRNATTITDLYARINSKKK